MEVAAVPIILIVVISIFIIFSQIHKKNIYDKIGSINGYVISYKNCSLFTGFGPFKIPSKGTYIYKVFYLLNDEKKEAWVKFGGFTGTKWVFDYKK